MFLPDWASHRNVYSMEMMCKACYYCQPDRSSGRRATPKLQPTSVLVLVEGGPRMLRETEEAAVDIHRGYAQAVLAGPLLGFSTG